MEKIYLIRDLTKNTWIGIYAKDNKPFGTDNIWKAYKFNLNEAKKYRNEFGTDKWLLFELLITTNCIDC